jgi:hypothetical protein
VGTVPIRDTECLGLFYTAIWNRSQFQRKVLVVKNTIICMSVNFEGATAWLYEWTAEIILSILIGIRLLLWLKFRRDVRARRLWVSTAQLIVVAAAVGACDFFGGTHLIAIAVSAVLAIACLSLIPAPRLGGQAMFLWDSAAHRFRVPFKRKRSTP